MTDDDRQRRRVFSSPLGGDDYRPAPGSPEAALADYLKPRDWVS